MSIEERTLQLLHFEGFYYFWRVWSVYKWF